MQRRRADARTDARAPLPAGTLVMLILKILSHGPLHGYAIAQEIKRASRDALHVEEGSLYPALQKMLARDWVTAEWVKVGPRREARVYRLTPAGRRQLVAEVSDFSRSMEAIVRVIRPNEA
jgi:PadR family transcriptional regulator, regulatory protein PadR